MNILVVDDSRAMRKVIRKSLEDMGYSSEGIHEAGDGVEALDVLAQTTVDLALVDWNMPRMNGLAFLRKTRESEALRDLPIVMVTGEAERTRVVEAIRSGARGYIVKPFTSDTLRLKIVALEKEITAGARPTDTAILRFDKASGDKALPLLEQLPEELAAGMHERVVRSEHAEGDVLVRSGEAVESLCFIERGEADLSLADGTSMTLGTGDFLAEQAFLSAEPAEVTVTATSSLVVARLSRDDFQSLMAEFPHLSFYLTRFLMKRVRGAAEKPAKQKDGLSGQLSLIPLAELVQTLHGSRKTGRLGLQGDGASGSIYFDEGQVTHAEVDGEEGEDGFYRMLSWEDGSFYFDTDARSPEKLIFRSTMSLLMEGMRRQDESGRDED
jgi:two-component system chemotaxis response regulator CheY